MKTNRPIRKLSEVIDLLGGFAFKSGDYSSNGYQLIRIANVKSGFIDSSNPVFISEKLAEKFSDYILENNDILISLTGNVGRVAKISEDSLPAILNQRVAKIVFVSEEIDEIYLYYVLSQIKFIQYCERVAVGMAQKNISNKQILEYEIPIPPLATQKKIVERLDAIQKAQELNDRQISKAEELFESTLSGEISKNKTWPNRKIGEICEELFAGGDVPKDYSKIRIGEYKIPIYSNGIGDKSLYGFTKKPRVDREAVTISARGTIGYPEIRNEPFYPAIRLIVAIPYSDIMNVKFLKFILGTIEIKRTGNTIPQLTVPMIRQEVITVPPLSEQQKIIEKLSAIQNYKKLLLKQKELLRELFDSVLHKSMNGEIDG